MRVTVEHALPVPEAKRRLDTFSDNLKQRFSGEAAQITQTWDGDVCQVRGKLKGFSLDCELRVAGTTVTATGAVPLFARPFQGMIEAAVRDGLKRALAG